MQYRPRASPELVKGYEIASGMADARGDVAEASGRVREASLWRELAEYCRRMAKTASTDDDQSQYVLGMRHRNERVMSKEQLRIAEEEGEILPLWDSEAKPLPEWKELAMELALGYLPPLQRVCYEMHHMSQLTYREIGEALNVTRNEAHTHVQRARKTIERKVRPAMSHIFDRPKIADEEC
jgi:RNA polymerase sigma factor (sigma-70 family)